MFATLRPRIMGLLAAVALCSLLATASAHAADDLRFSATLNREQRAAAGLNQLSEDNVAVIDGLVRQDLAASKFKNNNVDHTRFSQRHTAQERTIAGLERLSPAQLTCLDNLIHQRIVGTEVEFSEEHSPQPTPAQGSLVAVGQPPPPEVHGEVSYTLGSSRGGSFQGGGILLNYDDPARQFSILVAYSEFRGKGLPLCIYPSGGVYRPYLAPSLFSP